MTRGSRIIAFGSSGDGSAESGHGQTASTAEAGQTPAYETSEWQALETEPEYEVAERSMADRLLPPLALLLVVGWTGFYLWANRNALNGATVPADAASLIAIWTLPVMLIGVIWLLVMRSSTREATRFGNAARLLSDESALLESRLLTVNRELSLAREFISSQSRDLESLGRIASERLSSSADRLQALVAENGSRVETIGQVSAAALDNMEKLRGQLPVIASFAKDVTNNIANAGRTAHAQIEEMVLGFNRVNEFGQASEAQVHSLREHVGDTLAGLAEQCEQLETIATSRFAELSARSEEFRTRLDRQEIEALAAIRTRAHALADELESARNAARDAEQEGLQALVSRIGAIRHEGATVASALREAEERARDEWLETMAALEGERSALFSRIASADQATANQARARLAALEAEAALIESGIIERGERIASEHERRRATIEAGQQRALTSLAAMLADIDRDIELRSHAHLGKTDEAARRAEALSERLAFAQASVEQVAADAQHWDRRIGDTVARIAGMLAETKSRLGETENQLGGLTDSSLRLFELVHASAEQAGETLPRVLGQSDTTLSGMESRAAALVVSMERVGEESTALASRITTSQSAMSDLVGSIEGAQARLREAASEHLRLLGGLTSSLAKIDEQSDHVAHKARTELAESIAGMEAAARETLAMIDTQGAAGIDRISKEIQSRSAEAVGLAIHHAASEISGQLEQAASHAAGVSREATIQLRDQLSKVHELVANLENRVDRARERAEEQVDNDFARRAALITESLNSNAIDIAKALSTDVSDTAWAGYLRGDRGIFTRRAVSLIDNGEARAILQIFERDSDFRDHVSRYIHDFEAMLRQVLSTRDGNALGITLLSSDMGKLYVALAHGIERLRT